MDTRRALLPLLTGLLTAHGVRASDGAELKITVHLVWASDVATAGKGKDEHALPAELEAKLREKTKQKHFRLDARPTTSSLEPDKPEHLILLGDLRGARRDVDGARSAWNQALALDPSNRIARSRLGRVDEYLVDHPE